VSLASLRHAKSLFNHGNGDELVPVVVWRGEENWAQFRNEVCLILVAPGLERCSYELDTLGENRTHVKVFAHRATKESVQNPAAVNSGAALVHNDVLGANWVSDYVHALTLSELEYFGSDVILLVVNDKVCTHLILAKGELFICGSHGDSLCPGMLCKLQHSRSHTCSCCVHKDDLTGFNMRDFEQDLVGCAENFHQACGLCWIAVIGYSESMAGIHLDVRGIATTGQ